LHTTAYHTFILEITHFISITAINISLADAEQSLPHVSHVVDTTHWYGSFMCQ